MSSIIFSPSLSETEVQQLAQKDTEYWGVTKINGNPYLLMPLIRTEHEEVKKESEKRQKEIEDLKKKLAKSEAKNAELVTEMISRGQANSQLQLTCGENAKKFAALSELNQQYKKSLDDLQAKYKLLESTSSPAANECSALKQQLADEKIRTRKLEKDNLKLVKYNHDLSFQREKTPLLEDFPITPTPIRLGVAASAFTPVVVAPIPTSTSSGNGGSPPMSVTKIGSKRKSSDTSSEEEVIAKTSSYVRRRNADRPITSDIEDDFGCYLFPEFAALYEKWKGLAESNPKHTRQLQRYQDFKNDFDDITFTIHKPVRCPAVNCAEVNRVAGKNTPFISWSKYDMRSHINSVHLKIPHSVCACGVVTYETKITNNHVEHCRLGELEDGEIASEK